MVAMQHAGNDVAPQMKLSCSAVARNIRRQVHSRVRDDKLPSQRSDISDFGQRERGKKTYHNDDVMSFSGLSRTSDCQISCNS